MSRRVLAGALAVVVGGPIVVVLLASSIDSSSAQPVPAVQPSPAAIADIPADYLELYQAAAGSYQLDWAILAGIGKAECDHGRSPLTGCNPPGTINRAGARGPMQFLGSTWRATADARDPDVAGPPIPVGAETQGYATDADGDGTADPWSPTDAIWAAARLLRHSGAPADYSAAIWAYNHSAKYRSDVLGYAEQYRAAATTAPAADPGGPVQTTTVRGITVNVAIAPQLDALIAAAAADGHTLTGSGYRSNARQVELRRQNCGTSAYAIYQMPSSQCSPPTARPGSSMHEVGLAVDFSCDGALIRSRSTACFAWMAANAPRFGLHNLPSEPWHWSTDGT